MSSKLIRRLNAVELVLLAVQRGAMSFDRDTGELLFRDERFSLQAWKFPTEGDSADVFLQICDKLGHRRVIDCIANCGRVFPGDPD